MSLMIIGEGIDWQAAAKEAKEDVKAKAKKGIEDKARDVGKGAFDKVTGFFGKKLGIKQRTDYGPCTLPILESAFNVARFALNAAYVGKATLPIEIQATIVSVAIASRDALAFADGSKWQKWLPSNLMNKTVEEIAATKDLQMLYLKGLGNVIVEIRTGAYNPPDKLKQQLQKICITLLPLKSEAKEAQKTGYLKTTQTAKICRQGGVIVPCSAVGLAPTTKKTLLYVGGAVAVAGAVAAFAKFKGLI